MVRHGMASHCMASKCNAWWRNASARIGSHHTASRPSKKREYAPIGAFNVTQKIRKVGEPSLGPENKYSGQGKQHLTNVDSPHNYCCIIRPIVLFVAVHNAFESTFRAKHEQENPQHSGDGKPRIPDKKSNRSYII